MASVPQTRKGTNYLHGYDREGNPTQEIRAVRASVFTDQISVLLARPDGDPGDWNAAQVYTEWSPEKGWKVFIHPGDDHKAIQITLPDTGGYSIEEPT